VQNNNNNNNNNNRWQYSTTQTPPLSFSLFLSPNFCLPVIVSPSSYLGIAITAAYTAYACNKTTRSLKSGVLLPNC
jgi:hypothetical protein